MFNLATEHFQGFITPESAEAAADIYSWLLRIGQDKHGLFAIKADLGEELRTAVIASRLEAKMLDKEKKTVWFHQLKIENGRTDICLYVDDENQEGLIPAAIIEVGPRKQNQILSCCINVSSQLVSYNNVILSLEMLLGSDQL